MAILDLPSVPTPPDRLQRMQRQRKFRLTALCVLALIPLLFTASYWKIMGSSGYPAIRWVGAAMIVVSILGRTWSSLYIAGRKKRQLITVGPYSLTRNPLYIFTLLGAFGIGAQSGSLIVGSLFAFVTLLVFAGVVEKEEAFLRREFPVEFAAYAERVPRFCPRLPGWRDVEELVVKPRLIWRTFGEASLFLLSIPAADALETLQWRLGVPILVLLP